TKQTAVRNAVLLFAALVTWLDSWRGDGVFERLRDLGDGWWWLAGVVLAMVTTAFVVREGELPPYAPEDEGDDYMARPIPYTVLDGPEGPRTAWSLSETAARLLVFWDPTDENTAVVAARVPTWQQLLAPVRVHLVTQSEWQQAVDVRPDLAADLLGDPEGAT